MAKKWSRTTKGLNAQIFVSKPINYSTQATYAAFQANAAVGEIGLFDNTSPNPVLIPVSLLAAGSSFFIAQKQTVGIKKTPVYIMTTEVTPRKILYTAPINQVSAIGWNGAGGALNNPTIVPGYGGSNYEFAILEMTEGNDPYPNWNYNYTPKSGDTATDALQQLAEFVNDTTNPVYKNNLPLVTAGVRTNGSVTSFTLTAANTLNFTLGSPIATISAAGTFSGAVGDFIITPLGGAAVVPGNTNNNTYKIIATVATVSITLDRPWSEPTIAMTQAQVQGAASGLNKTATITANGLILTAINANETFRMAVRGDLVNADRFDLLSYTRGSGTYDEIVQLEQEATTFAGNTAKNTVFGDAAFGNPDQFALSTDTYDYFYFDVRRLVTLTNVISEGTNRSQLLIAAARSAGNLKAQLQTIFGI